MARFGDEASRKRGYLDERSYRWGMEDFFRDSLIETFCDRYGHALGRPVTWQRNDDRVRQWPRGTPMPDWVAGTPDYSIAGSPDATRVELKVKSELFRKTKKGAQGGYPGYSTESHYIDPYVLDQLDAHCSHEKLSTKEILILFAYSERAAEDYRNRTYDPARWEFHYLMFEMILTAIRAERYIRIKESGYGEPSYLIPISDLVQLGG